MDPSVFLNANLGLLILRLAVAIIFLYHGLPKLMKAGMMGQMMGMSGGEVFMLGMIEALSGIGLLLGIYIQLASILLSIVMVGAIYFKMTKWKTRFSAMDKTGWEFDFILLASNLAIFFTGGGYYRLIQ
ncbi:MAG: DoxX family protein [Candidatus Yanofskybacteria bacterium]|nr:DoxX family protein [Candidatus Yanofskybacteria bacterium]